MINIYCTKINKVLSKDIYNRLLNKVSIEKQRKIKKFRFYEDAQRSLLAELLIRYALKQEWQIEKNIAFSKNEYGKPYLAELPNVHFNISHSGDWVVCVVDNQPIGIDVEEIKSVDFKIAERFFAKAEYEALQKISESDRLNYFFKIWTLKESYIKAVGKGLAIPLGSFVISFNKQNEIYFSSDTSNQKYFFNQFFIDNKHILALFSIH